MLVVEEEEAGVLVEDVRASWTGRGLFVRSVRRRGLTKGQEKSQLCRRPGSLGFRNSSSVIPVRRLLGGGSRITVTDRLGVTAVCNKGRIRMGKIKN